MVEISCIIPTYNRSPILLKTLKGLVRQTYSEPFEIIIIDDGSTDKTWNIVDDYIKGYKEVRIIWQLIHQENKGPSAARNKGIINARGKYILFLGDDTIPDDKLLQEHLGVLQKDDDICSLGIVKWHPDAKNENLKAFKIAGIQIDYAHIGSPEDCAFTYFCTANVGLSKKLLLEERFDENFPYAAMEDTDLGYRLAKRGLKIFLNQKAIVYHLHHYDEKDIIARQETIGKSVAFLIKKNPELNHQFIKTNAKAIFMLSAILVKLPFIKMISKDLYWLALSTYSKYKY